MTYNSTYIILSKWYIAGHFNKIYQNIDKSFMVGTKLFLKKINKDPIINFRNPIKLSKIMGMENPIINFSHVYNMTMP